MPQHNPISSLHFASHQCNGGLQSHLQLPSPCIAHMHIDSIWVDLSFQMQTPWFLPQTSFLLVQTIQFHLQTPKFSLQTFDCKLRAPSSKSGLMQTKSYRGLP